MRLMAYQNESRRHRDLGHFSGICGSPSVQMSKFSPNSLGIKSHLHKSLGETMGGSETWPRVTRLWEQGSKLWILDGVYFFFADFGLSHVR